MRTTKSTPIGVWLGLVSLVMDHKGLAQSLLQDETGMPWSRFRLLRRVEDRSRTQRELTELMSVDAPAVSVIVGDLVARGHVERVPSATDGRVKQVQITASGRALLERLRDLPDVIPAPVAALSPDERRLLAHLIDVMRAGVDE